jgi:hypothetical protein
MCRRVYNLDAFQTALAWANHMMASGNSGAVEQFVQEVASNDQTGAVAMHAMASGHFSVRRHLDKALGHLKGVAMKHATSAAGRVLSRLTSGGEFGASSGVGMFGAVGEFGAEGEFGAAGQFGASGRRRERDGDGFGLGTSFRGRRM